MNVTVTQDNSRIEQLGSNGANIIEKMYQLAIDPNNTVSYSGYLKSDSGYVGQILYLNNTFGPGLRIEATKEYVDFEDPVVRQICVSNWGDGVGVTTELLANVTIRDIGDKFKNNTQITKFNEFKYFTGINQNGWTADTSYFMGCSNLTEITIPKNIRQMVVEVGPFLGCTLLRKVNYSPDCQLEKSILFKGCTSLLSPLIFPNSVTIFANNTIIDENGLYTLPNINTIVMGNNVQRIEPASNGYGVQHNFDFIIQTITPPTLDSTWWINDKVTFYVPDEAVSNYKAADNWSNISSLIKPISQYSGSEWSNS